MNSKNNKQARAVIIGKPLWDSADQRAGHYALLLAIANNLRPEQAFAVLRGEPMPGLSQSDCEDIAQMRKRSICYADNDNPLPDGAGMKWRELEGVYCIGRAELKRVCGRHRCKAYYRSARAAPLK